MTLLSPFPRPPPPIDEETSVLDFRYLEFCLTAGHFYEKPPAESSENDFSLVHGDLPEGWERSLGSEWAVFTPPDPGIPEQGWKVHVSATLDNAEELLRTVFDYCVERRIMFKFIRSLRVLQRRNSKYGDRSASGKFITIYPRDEAHLERILCELDELIGGAPGPYILSDLRWRSGPLYVRYGGFTLMMGPSPTGELVPCLRDPDGNLVPDERRPGFRVPDWVEVPSFLDEALAQRRAGTLRDFPFRPYKALHFSNGGGVYLARDIRTGEDVLLKEARPMAGLDNNRVDAATRLEQERWALETLADLPHVPRLIDYRRGHEHLFLAREYVPGIPLNHVVAQRNPLLVGDTDPTRYADYTRWALHIMDQVEQGVRGMHDRGIAFGDLHPGNILVRPDDSIVFIDLETASPADSGARQAMGALGYSAPPDMAGPDVDLFALACLRLGLFVPFTHVISWGEDKYQQIIGLVTERFPLPDDYVARIREGLGPSAPPVKRPAEPLWPAPTRQTWPTLATALTSGIREAATPGREDRLYPGDIRQFLTPGAGLGFGYGAAGVLWALDTVGQPVPEEHVRWLVDRVRDVEGMGPGFYDGLSGIAYALDRIGRPETARELLAAVWDCPRDHVNASLLDGLSGLGLALLHFSDCDGALERAAELGVHVARPWLVEGTPARRVGLLHGGAGQALFLTRLYEQGGGGEELLDAAERALRADVAAVIPPGVDEGALACPAGLSGGPGMALALRVLLRHRPDPELDRMRRMLLRSAARQLSSFPGLFNGRAGTLLALVDQWPSDRPVALIDQHLSAFGWDAVRVGSGLLLLGDQSLRLSTDLATGTSGVVLALHTVVEGRPCPLPFLDDSAPALAGGGVSEQKGLVPA